MVFYTFPHIWQFWLSQEPFGYNLFSLFFVFCYDFFPYAISMEQWVSGQQMQSESKHKLQTQNGKRFWR